MKSKRIGGSSRDWPTAQPPIGSRAEFRSEAGQKNFWRMVAAKVVSSFGLPCYNNFNIYTYTEAVHDLMIYSNKKYKFKVRLDENVNVSVINVYSHHTVSKCFEYFDGDLFEI